VTRDGDCGLLCVCDASGHGLYDMIHASAAELYIVLCIAAGTQCGAIAGCAGMARVHHRSQKLRCMQEIRFMG
jgi:hypothetical protein